jgi:uncharacterized protein YcbK (DUF882 family)
MTWYPTPIPPPDEPALHRRKAIKFGVLAVVIGMTPGWSMAQRHSAPGSRRILDLYHTRTGERLKAVYWAEGQYISEALVQVNHLLRDYRTDDMRPIDPRLLDLLHALGHAVDAPYAFHIVSAYRSPATNAYLRQHRQGVAKDSQHMYGRAVDFYLPKRELAVVRRAAVHLHRGGVGYYPQGHFLHVDTGPVRAW